MKDVIDTLMLDFVKLILILMKLFVCFGISQASKEKKPKTAELTEVRQCILLGDQWIRFLQVHFNL